MLKIYPSSSAFDVDGLTYLKYPSSCKRMLLAKDLGFKDTEINPKYAILGERGEVEFEEELINSGKFGLILVEDPFKFESEDAEWIVSGRSDFICYPNSSDEPIVFEKKSSLSKSVIYAARKGEVPLNYLAQLVCYLVMRNLTVGVLSISGYTEKKDGSIVPSVQRANKEVDKFKFIITFSDNKEILINGRLSGFSVLDFANHLLSSVEVRNQRGAFPDKPASESQFTNACRFCGLSDVCNNLEAETFDNFIHDVKEKINGDT